MQTLGVSKHIMYMRKEHIPQFVSSTPLVHQMVVEGRILIIAWDEMELHEVRLGGWALPPGCRCIAGLRGRMAFGVWGFSRVNKNPYRHSGGAWPVLAAGVAAAVRPERGVQVGFLGFLSFG